MLCKMKSKKIISFASLLIIKQFVFAQVNFKAQVKNKNIAIGDIFEVYYEADRDIDNFKVSIFKNFEIISGPSPTVSKAWRNGESSYVEKNTYKLKAIKAGVLELPKAVCTYKSKEIYSNTITVEVVDLNKKLASQSTASWNYKSKKLTLIDENEYFNEYSIKKSIDYNKLLFYKTNNSEITKIDTSVVLPQIGVRDVLDLKSFKNDGYNLLDYIEFFKFFIQQLKKPKNNGDLIFEISFDENTFKTVDQKNAINILKKYANSQVVYEFKQGVFSLKNNL